MNDKVLVRVMNGVAQCSKQFKALAHGELIRVAVFVDPSALDVFHHQIGQSVIRLSAVDQSRDVRVLKLSECLTFLFEASAAFIGRQTPVDQLHRDALLKRVVGAFAKPDHSHPTTGDRANEAESTYALTAKVFTIGS